MTTRSPELKMIINYFNLQRFCVHDGPGIRTTLFMKGCPLRCLWCHNPEGQSPSPELIFRSDKCVGCGACLGKCGARTKEGGAVSVDRSKCTLCGKCVDVCVSGCSEICGGAEDADVLYEKLIRDERYFKDSHGGITLSGGEPLLQPEAVLYLAGRAKEDGIGFAVETSGYCDAGALAELSALGTLFLYDIKGADPVRHEKNTGVSNERIISNLEALAGRGADIIIRLPLVPGYNDSEEDLDELSSLLGKFKRYIRRAEIMPYHRIGLGKLETLGRTSPLSGVHDGREFAAGWKKKLEKSGVILKIN